MKIYKIPVVWQMMGFHYVKADSLDDATDLVSDGMTPLPGDPSYLEGSFEVGYEGIDASNDGDEGYTGRIPDGVEVIG